MHAPETHPAQADEADLQLDANGQLRHLLTLQGLDKMALVASFGVPQLILPPQLCPDIPFLRQLGFHR